MSPGPSHQRHPHGPTRGDFIFWITVAAALVILLYVTLANNNAGEKSKKPGAATPAKAWEPIAGLPAKEPKQLYAENGLLEVDLTPEPRTINVSGSPILAQPWKNSLTGPTLHLEAGDTLRVDLQNGLDEPTNIHYHGLHISPKGDGDNVFRTMRSGEEYVSEITIPQGHATGTFWYHVHFHGNTETQVMGGLTGLLVVEGLEDKLPEDLQDVEQHQLVLRDIQTTKSGKAIQTKQGKIDPGKPSTWLVNGRLRPILAEIQPGEVQLWRIANTGADLFYHLKLQDHSFTVIAEDGNPVWESYETDDLVLPPGKRYDVLVQGGEVGEYELKTIPYDEGFELLPQKTLAKLPVAGEAVTDQKIPAKPIELTPKAETELTDSPITKRRTFRFSFGTGPGGEFEARINGEVFDPSEIDVTPVVDTVEQWRLVNNSDEDHPFHIHINDFQVMSVNGKPYDAHGLQDVVIIPKDGGEVVIRNPFEEYTGEFVFHCHILGHEDAGMMQSVEVVDSTEAARDTQHIDQGTAHSQMNHSHSK